MIDSAEPPIDDELRERLASRQLSPAAPIMVRRVVDAAASDVWRAISAPGNLANVHPFCRANDVERWPGPASRDHVRYYSGIHYQRDCTAWVDGVGYDLEVGPPDAKTAAARWVIEPVSPGRAVFSIEVVSYLRTDLPPDRLDRYTRDVVEHQIPPYLDGVVRGVAHFVETGVPVSRNQFGPHPIYSP